MLSFDFSPGVRRALRIDICATLLVTAFTGLTGPFNALILRRELGATPLQLSLLASANAACLLLSLGLARLVDSRRPLPYVVWSAFAARALFLLVPWIASPWPFVGILVAGNLFATLAGPAQSALVQRVYPQAERGRALSAVRVTGAVPAIALSAVAGRLLLTFSYRWVFFAAAIVGMVAALTQSRLPVPAAAADAPPERLALADAWRTIGDDRGFRRLLVASSVFGSGIWVMMPATPLLMADVLNVTTAQVGVLSSVAAGTALLGSLFWGRLVDRGSSLAAISRVYLFGTLTPLIYFALARLHGPSWVLVGASVSESLMATGLDLVWMLAVIDFAGPRRVAQYAAITGTLAGVRGIVGPLLGAALIQSVGVHAVYLVAAGLMATGAWLVARQAQSAQKIPRYSEQPRQTSGGLSVRRAALKLS